MTTESLLCRLEEATRGLATHLAEERPDFLEFLESREETITALRAQDPRQFPDDARVRLEEDLRWGEQVRAAVLARQARLRQKLMGLNRELGLARQFGGAGGVQKTRLGLRG